ncbi:hypothetical protein GCM10007036_29150 [Alsobacter metallidurans]|uniref:Anti-sigma K factor RskA C-terminal domain-containing protein n=1 Tax=Alsobacter metallidurans TaxID=340221 RepID=A0A917MIC6_9HYPH|nr:anti-sigma factor [Alsobacter metallidurans]GGH23410.1 hypothetical protein GCM10007036_29150 [Alsobacter metallidurans]
MSDATTRDELAAEHALGVLEGEDAARADALMEQDPAFAAAVTEWRVRLSDLDAIADRAAPSGDLWGRIESGLAATPAKPESSPASVEAATAHVLPFRSAGAARPSIWQSLPAWRAATGFAAAAAVVLAVGAAYFADKAARTPTLVAVLLEEGSAQPAAVVNAFADGRTELVPLRAIAAPPGRALEIWTLWDRAVGPKSVGLIGEARATRLDLSKLPKPGPNQLFEITVEPASGSPTGRPTGPILMKGLTATAL